MDAAAPAASALSEARVESSVSGHPLKHVMKYMPPLVLVPVTLEYQAKKENLFRENPAPLCCFLASTFSYWLIIDASEKFATLCDLCSDIANRAAFAMGALSALSLVSMFLPYPMSLVPLIIWTLVPVVLAWPLIFLAYGMLKGGITNAINKIPVGGLNSTKGESLPVEQECSAAHIKSDECGSSSHEPLDNNVSSDFGV